MNNNFYQRKRAELNELLSTLDKAKNSIKGLVIEEKFELETEIEKQRSELRERERRIVRERELVNKMRVGVVQMVKERQLGFPWLANAVLVH